jgi:hypothetical protein
MPKSIRNGPLSPDEFQRQLQEFMRKHFHGSPLPGFTQTEESGKAGLDPDEADKNDFDFDYKPRDVKAYLDRFVIKQEEAKKV